MTPTLEEIFNDLPPMIKCKLYDLLHKEYQRMLSEIKEYGESETKNDFQKWMNAVKNLADRIKLKEGKS